MKDDKNTTSSTEKKPTDKQTKKEIFRYGLGGITSTLPTQFKNQYSLNFMADVAGINIGVVGVWMSLMTIWDAINDPLIGGIADRTNNKRFGKYRPHMMMGSLGWGLMTFLLFCSPNLKGNALVAYYVVGLFLFSIFYTQFTVPWQAMNSIMSSDPHTRNKFLTARQLFGFVAAPLGIALGQIIVAAFGPEREKIGWMVAAGVVGICIVVSGFICADGLKRKDYYNSIPEPPKSNFKGQMSVIIGNKAVICAALLLGFATVTNAFNTNISVSYFKYAVGKPIWISLNSILQLVIGVITVSILPSVMKKVSKIRIMLVGMFIPVIAAIPIGIFGTKINMFWLIITNGLIVISFAICNMTAMSLVPDCTDYTELHYGSAQAGFINSMITFMKKLFQSLSLVIVTTPLAAVGYEAGNTTNDPKVLNTIIMLKVVVPIIAFILTVIVLRIYPITTEYGIQMRKELEIARAKKAQQQ